MWHKDVSEKLINLFFFGTTSRRSFTIAFNMAKTSTSKLKILLLLLCTEFVQPQESTRTCRQSLMVALKSIFEQNANEVCVSLLHKKYQSSSDLISFIAVGRGLKGYVGSDFWRTHGRTSKHSLIITHCLKNTQNIAYEFFIFGLSSTQNVKLDLFCSDSEV